MPRTFRILPVTYLPEYLMRLEAPGVTLGRRLGKNPSVAWKLSGI